MRILRWAGACLNETQGKGEAEAESSGIFLVHRLLNPLGRNQRDLGDGAQVPVVLPPLCITFNLTGESFCNTWRLRWIPGYSGLVPIDSTLPIGWTLFLIISFCVFDSFLESRFMCLFSVGPR